jgi:hypothetical protein
VSRQSSPSLGDNINGPTVVRVPSWVKRPLGRYYMYFAHHMGTYIRLAYADAIEGPWRIHEPGVLPVEDTAFYRPQPDPPENLANFYTHVASPEVIVDEASQRLVLWFHGWWTNGERWPVGEAAASAWARERGYGQFTQVATSSDGLHFTVMPAITRTSYLRVFRWDGMWYGVSRLGLLSRAADPLASFETAASVFRGTAVANRVRHVALLRREHRVHIFFSSIGDAPERIQMSTMTLAGDWRTWQATSPVDVLVPEAPYECATLPNRSSEGGDIKEPARQLRDPAIFEESGRTFVFYSYCGEQGIAAAELTISPSR